MDFFRIPYMHHRIADFRFVVKFHRSWPAVHSENSFCDFTFIQLCAATWDSTVYSPRVLSPCVTRPSPSLFPSLPFLSLLFPSSLSSLPSLTAVRMWLCRQQLLRVKCHREKMAVKIQTGVCWCLLMCFCVVCVCTCVIYLYHARTLVSRILSFLFSSPSSSFSSPFSLSSVSSLSSLFSLSSPSPPLFPHSCKNVAMQATAAESEMSQRKDGCQNSNRCVLMFAYVFLCCMRMYLCDIFISCTNPCVSHPFFSFFFSFLILLFPLLPLFRFLPLLTLLPLFSLAPSFPSQL